MTSSLSRVYTRVKTGWLVKRLERVVVVIFTGVEGHKDWAVALGFERSRGTGTGFPGC